MKIKGCLFIITIIFSVNVFCQDTIAIQKIDTLNRNTQNADAEIVFVKVEKEPEFPGGVAAWQKYLEHNLNGLIAVTNNAPPGKYSVFMSFIVEKDGSVTNFSVKKNPGYGTAQEVRRVIENGPKWIPGMQNGSKVRALKMQPVTFIVQ